MHLLLLLGLALPAWAAHEALSTAPDGWSEAGTPDQDELMILQVALQQQNLDKLESLIYEVSTPGSDSYGKYLDKDSAAAITAPSDDAAPAVENWLKEAGVDAIHTEGEYVTFAASVKTANQLLQTEFQYYESDGITKLRTLGYSVPDELTQHIDFITPTTFFGKTTAQAPVFSDSVAERRDMAELSKREDIDPSCKTLITPACIKQVYNIGTYTPDPDSGSKIGFGSFLNQSARTNDLDLFETKYDIPQQGFSVQLINGGTNDQSISVNHGEANLDVEYIVGTSHPLPIISYITGGSPPFIPNLDEPNASVNTNEPYLNYYNYLLSQSNEDLPAVISNSYGDDEQTVPERYARRVCFQIGILGLRGISVLESSGDTGVGAPCQSNDGKKTPQFTPQFPGTCPFITAVGGTQSLEPEIAWIASSGGFSNYFSRPWYQSFAVSDYLNNYISPETLEYFAPFFNQRGRAFPDVAAHSLTPRYSVYNNDALKTSGGTSAAVPVFSSIIALLNDARFRAGKPSLGFLNPWLYAYGYKGLTDITAGGALGCTGVNLQTGQTVPGASIIPYASWNATTGWDPATGLGVPDFQALLSLVL